MRKLIAWLRRKLEPGKDDDVEVLSDEEFARLFEHKQDDVQTAREAPAFGNVWATLLDTDECLREAVGKMREANRKMQGIVSNLEKKFGVADRAINDTFVPLLERHFNVMGFFFQRSAEKARFGNPEYPSCYVEIDLFLENHSRAVAVAAKAETTIDDILQHIERMEKLRRHFDLHNDRRELYGTVAAAVFPADAPDFALDRGLYVVEYSADQIAVTKPPSGARVW